MVKVLLTHGKYEHSAAYASLEPSISTWTSAAMAAWAPDVGSGKTAFEISRSRAYY